MSNITLNPPEVRASKPSKNSSNPSRYESIVKTILWTLGTIVVCLAIVDLFAQTHARETEIGLQNAQAEKLDVHKDLRISDIDSLIIGSPTVEIRPADKYTNMCLKMKKYTWKGFFKNYSISVYIGQGVDPSIDFIHGSGDHSQSTDNYSVSL